MILLHFFFWRIWKVGEIYQIYPDLRCVSELWIPRCKETPWSSSFGVSFCIFMYFLLFLIKNQWFSKQWWWFMSLKIDDFQKKKDDLLKKLLIVRQVLKNDPKQISKSYRFVWFFQGLITISGPYSNACDRTSPGLGRFYGLETWKFTRVSLGGSDFWANRSGSTAL